MAVYEYVGRTFKVSADIVGAEMEKIEKKEGAITSRNLLDAGRSKDSPLHPLFEWDDGKAAELYRLKQASDIITHITIKVSENENTPYRGWVNIIPSDDSKTTKAGRFINIRTAMENDEMRKIVLNNAVHEMEMFSVKYSKYKELSDVFIAMENVITRIKEAS